MTLDDHAARGRWPEHLKMEVLAGAIEASGYPLQTIVAARLRKRYSITEEWGFPDGDSGDIRTLDVWANHPLPSLDSRVVPSARLLIECKRSVHPYVFFEAVAPSLAGCCPTVVGPPGGQLPISAKSKLSQHTALLSRILGLDDTSFVDDGPPVCSSLSRAEAKGSNKFMLSGDEPYNSVVLPLVKALRFLREHGGAWNDRGPVYPALVVALAVIDAPMVLVRPPAASPGPIHCSWVRLLRHELRRGHRSHAPDFYAIDMIHPDFLDAYLEDHFEPFALTFAERATSAAGILLNGAVAPSLESWSWTDLTPRG